MKTQTIEPNISVIQLSTSTYSVINDQMTVESVFMDSIGNTMNLTTMIHDKLSVDSPLMSNIETINKLQIMHQQ